MKKIWRPSTVVAEKNGGSNASNTRRPGEMCPRPDPISKGPPVPRAQPQQQQVPKGAGEASRISRWRDEAGIRDRRRDPECGEEGTGGAGMEGRMSAFDAVRGDPTGRLRTVKHVLFGGGLCDDGRALPPPATSWAATRRRQV